MTRAEILEKARQCVCGHRENEYGTPENSFDKIAKLWTAYKGVDFSSVDVSMMMALLKIARIAGDKATDDSFIDLAGYAACGGEISSKNEGLINVATEPELVYFGTAFIKCNDGMSVYNPIFKRYAFACEIADKLTKYAKNMISDEIRLNDFYGLIDCLHISSKEMEYVSMYGWRTFDLRFRPEVIDIGLETHRKSEFVLNLPMLHNLNHLSKENNDETE